MVDDNGGSGRPAKDAPTIKSVETSFAIVEALQDLESATMTEIAEYTDLSKGGIYKHLKTLQANSFVIKDGNEYRLGLRFLDVGGQLRFKYPGASIIKAKIQELAEETNEACLFTVRENDRAVTLFRETGNRGVSTRTRVGTRLYLHQTAGGKAILSQLPRSDVEDLIETAGLPRATSNTITEPEALFDELEEVRERGYAYNRAESTEGLIAIAAPLVPNETVLGACAITGPYHRMKGDTLTNEVPDMLLSVVNELELNIAHSR
ncbi:IclR family transcriptional regulator [Natrarchaeobius sp. A-rgal3]|uniref:IclR family transcriptional regulator n=1 Tax=Natrarchaeobius versutus TaxID=1679078 RepID=UPI003510BA3B